MVIEKDKETETNSSEFLSLSITLGNPWKFQVRVASLIYLKKRKKDDSLSEETVLLSIEKRSFWVILLGLFKGTIDFNMISDILNSYS